MSDLIFTAIDKHGNEQIVTDLYWFEEEGVHEVIDGVAEGHNATYRIEVQKISDLQRREELLRAALLGAWSWNDGVCPCCSFYPKDGHLPDCKYKAAIDGGAMEGE